MAKKTGLSQSTVSRVRRAFGLQPHRSETLKLSTDPFFVDKVHDVVDVVGLYLDPPERALVLCVDEKPQIQALDRSQPVLPMMPRVPERDDRLRDDRLDECCDARFGPPAFSAGPYGGADRTGVSGRAAEVSKKRNQHSSVDEVGWTLVQRSPHRSGSARASWRRCSTPRRRRC